MDQTQFILKVVELAALSENGRFGTVQSGVDRDVDRTLPLAMMPQEAAGFGIGLQNDLGALINVHEYTFACRALSDR